MIKVKRVLGLIVIVALLIGGSAPFLASMSPAVAQDTETLHLAPLNPDFLDFLQQPSQPFYGYVPPTMDLSHLKEIPVQREKALQALPATFDWRTQGKVTPVKDQNPCGTCWIHGILAAVESRVWIVDEVEYDFSEQNVACCTDPAWVYLIGNRCMGGGNSLRATDVLNKKGTRLESCDLYNTETINTEVCNDACTTIKRITGYRLVADSASQITEVKNAVYDYGPVSMAYCHDPGLFDEVTNIYYWPDCTEDANHLVCIVGWDDTIGWPGGAGNGAWIVKNSWGIGFGDDGYFYLCYGSGNMEEVASYRYEDYDANETVYYWDEAGYVGYAGYEDTSAWMASVFTSGQDGALTHVDFWTTSNNATYELYVYDGSFGSQLAYQTGSCAEFGYYSIPLTTPVPMTNGQQFTVAVKMTTPGFNNPVPVEGVISGICQPPIQTGVCFARYLDGDSWEEVGQYGLNVCLRAKITTPGSPPEVWVDDDWAGSNSGDPVDGHTFGTDAFAKIQDGIDAVASPGIVHVAAGEYDAFEVKSRSDLSIIGEDATVVDASELGGPGDWVMALIKDSTGINIEGIDFNGTGISPPEADMLSGICYLNSTGSIADLTVSNITGAPIAWGIGVVEVEEGVVDLSGVTVKSSKLGIFIWNAEANLDGCTITGMSPDGGTGIVARDGAIVSVENSEISDCWVEDPEAGAGLGMTIGIPEQDENLSTVDMTGCTISGNNLGIYIDEDGELVAHFNNIVENDVCGVLKEAPPAVDATHNWWGTAVELAINVSDYVDYSPWLNAPYPDGKPVTTDFTTISLESGWNLISLSLIPDESDITEVISADTLASGDVSNVGIVRSYDPATGQFPYYMPATGNGELTEMRDGYGYWVFMDAADTLIVAGQEMPTPPATPPTYPVVVGWNLIGFKSAVDMNSDDYLLNIAGTYPVLWIYYPDLVIPLWVNVKGGTMKVGHGFWLWVEEDGTIVPPA